MSNRHKGHVYIGSVGPWPMDKVGPQFGRPTMTQPGHKYDVQYLNFGCHVDVYDAGSLHD